MKNKYFIRFLVHLACTSSVFFLLSCGKETEPYYFQDDLDTFDTLLLNAVFQVELIEGDHNGIVIEGDKQVAEGISYSISDHTLAIENNNTALWRHPGLEPPKLTITFTKLNWVHADETCTIFSSTPITTKTFGITLGGKLNFADLQLDCELFFFWNTSPVGGKLTLHGHSDLIRLYNANLMAIDARELTCHDAVVQNASKADIHVEVDQRLFYSITGTGNIYLTGNPGEIEVGTITSTGKLIQ